MTYLEAIARLQRSKVVITNQRVASLAHKTLRGFLVWKSRHRNELKDVVIIDRVTQRRRHQIQRLLWQAHVQARSDAVYEKPCIAMFQVKLGVSRGTVGRLLRKEPQLRTLLRVHKD